MDPHFGTRDDLRSWCSTAHSMGIRVILDVILNHAGDVFRYGAGDPAWNGQKFPVRGFRDAQGDGQPSLRAGRFERESLGVSRWRDLAGGVSARGRFTREGQIRNFDFFPEFADGDFFSLKDLHHGERRIVNGVDSIDEYSASPTLRDLCEVYKFWIAFADIDGFRLDTVKHMDPGATRFFASVIHEFAQALGKENFYIIGEITGGREFAFDRLEVTGLDAALGISDERGKMTGLVKGEIDPAEYFDLFRNSLLVRKDSHVWFRDKVVTSVDDHDHVDQGEHKHRFCAGGFGNSALAVLALKRHDARNSLHLLRDRATASTAKARRWRRPLHSGSDVRWRIRRLPFARPSCLRRGPTRLSANSRKIHGLRRKHLPLRRGRQFLRQISGNGLDFGFPAAIRRAMRSIVAWSRIFNDGELLCAINTDPDRPPAFVTIDNGLHAAGARLTCLYSNDAASIGHTIAVEPKNGKAVSLTVSASGFVIYG